MTHPVLIGDRLEQTAQAPLSFRSRSRLLTTKLFRHLLIAGFSLGAFGSVVGQSLPEVIRKTLLTNPDVQIEVQRRLAADQAKDRAAAGWFPVIDLRAGTGREEKSNRAAEAIYGGTLKQDRHDFELTLSQMLFDGMGTSSEVRRNDSRVQSAAHHVAATSEQIALRTIESYLEILRQQVILELTQDNLLFQERTLDQIQHRVAGGFTRPSDLDQIRARVALAKANLTTAEANREVALINYKLVVGELPGPLERPIAPEMKWFPTDVDGVVRLALDANRLLHAARADVDAADAQRAAARSALAPRVALEIGRVRNLYQTQIDNPNEDTTYAMIRLRYNIFAGGSDYARINEAQHQENEAREVLNRAQRQLEQSVRLSWNAYLSARDRLPNLRQFSESSRLTRDAYTKQFSLGQRSLLDMLDSENEYFTAQSNLMNGQFVELFARYRLLADAGYLLAVLDINPPEESIANEKSPSAQLLQNIGFSGASGQAPPKDVSAPTATAVSSYAGAPVSVTTYKEVAKSDGLTFPSASTPANGKATPESAAIITAVNEWVDAWSRKDIDGYLSAYAEDFQPAQGQSRIDWESGRKLRFEKASAIKVDYSQPPVILKTNGIATIRLRQAYVLDTLNVVETKELTLVRRDGKWRIVSERVIP